MGFGVMDAGDIQDSAHVSSWRIVVFGLGVECVGIGRHNVRILYMDTSGFF